MNKIISFFVLNLLLTSCQIFYQSNDSNIQESKVLCDKKKVITSWSFDFRGFTKGYLYKSARAYLKDDKKTIIKGLTFNWNLASGYDELRESYTVPLKESFAKDQVIILELGGGKHTFSDFTFGISPEFSMRSKHITCRIKSYKLNGKALDSMPVICANGFKNKYTKCSTTIGRNK